MRGGTQSDLMPAIELDHVTKVYRRHGHRRQFATLKSALLTGSLVRHLRPGESFSALRDVSVSVPKGACFGVIGRNGSGKSTLLKLVAGITKPTAGVVRVQGRVYACCRGPARGQSRRGARARLWRRMPEGHRLA